MIYAVLALTLFAAPAAESATEVCRFTDDRLNEISGMALSRQHPDILWVHNDSSGGPYLYAVSASTCDVQARIEISGIEARDLEGMAVGIDRRGRPVIWLGDIGDNRDSWPSVTVHRIREPSVIRDETVTARSYQVTYPGGPLNAETLLADPDSQQLWIVTKQLARGGLYSFPDPPRDVNELRRIREEGPLITDGAVAPSGTQYVLRDYVNATIYRGLPPGELVAKVELPLQLQGEAITWTADESALLVTSERDDRLLRVPLEPREPEPSIEEATDPEPIPAPVDPEGDQSWLWLVPVSVAVATVIGIVEWLRRRGRYNG